MRPTSPDRLSIRLVEESCREFLLTGVKKLERETLLTEIFGLKPFTGFKKFAAMVPTINHATTHKVDGHLLLGHPRLASNTMGVDLSSCLGTTTMALSRMYLHQAPTTVKCTFLRTPNLSIKMAPWPWLLAFGFT